MRRTCTHYLLMSAIWLSAVSCKDDDISAPPKPSLQADKTSAEVGEEITFTINEVNAEAVSLLPYGLPGGDAGILLNFNGGVATSKFSYDRPGTFQAVVVANNHSSDGEIVQNVKSDPVTITITSSKNAISDFRFVTFKETETETEVLDVSTETEIDEDAKTITVTVPYGTDVTKLTAAFAASPHSAVKVGGTAQESEETVNNFSSPVVYTVTANNGATSNYTVTVNVTPVETDTTIESITALAVSESADEKELGVSVDNAARIIVVYDTLGTPSDQFDSVRIGYELGGDFAILKYGNSQMDQDSLLNLTSTQEFDVYSQDSTTAGGIQTYSVYSADAPKLALSFTGLNPNPAAGVEPVNFDLEINVLAGTDVSGINTVATTTKPVGVTVTGMKVDGATFVSGTAVDYSEPVEFQLNVTDANLGVSYVVTYTVTVTVIP
jgi:hypothetical protein